MREAPTNSDDVIDSRDVIARIAEIEAMGDDKNLAQEDLEELTALRALADEADSSPDWRHGETLVRESYFVEYAQELADSIGAIDRNAKWPLDCIDWEKAARELKMDYFSVDFDGVTYYIRG